MGLLGEASAQNPGLGDGEDAHAIYRGKATASTTDPIVAQSRYHMSEGEAVYIATLTWESTNATSTGLGVVYFDGIPSVSRW